MSSFEEKVKKEILKTGLPTEIKATTILKNVGWSVFNEYPYLDKDENKIRTLDIMAKKQFLKADNIKADDSTKISSACELYIECKKSSKQTWVFYTEQLPLSFLKYYISRIVDDVLSKYRFPKLSTQHKIKNQTKHANVFSKIPLSFKGLEYKIALSQQNVFSDKKEFYEGKMQVLKALRHKDEEDKAKPKKTSFPVNVIPIILFDGHIFECYYEGRKLITPEIEYTRYLAHGLPNQRYPALIDVMTLNYFPKYLNIIEKEFRTSSK